MKWPANGLQDAFPKILKGANDIRGATYQRTDNQWVMPALKDFGGKLFLVYEDRKNDQTTIPAIKKLKPKKFTGDGRLKTNIMHDKFLVDVKAGRVLMNSANFTPEGLTCQANLLHMFNSPQLATILQYDPTQLAILPRTLPGRNW